MFVNELCGNMQWTYDSKKIQPAFAGGAAWIGFIRTFHFCQFTLVVANRWEVIRYEPSHRYFSKQTRPTSLSLSLQVLNSEPKPHDFAFWLCVFPVEAFPWKLLQLPNMQLATLAIWWFGLICWGKQAWAAAFDSHGSYAKSTRLDNSEHPLLKLKLLNSHIDHWKNSTWICPLPRQVAWGFACSKVDGLENVLHHLTWCRKQSPPAFQPRKGCWMFEKPYPKHHVYCIHMYTICISSVCMSCM